jgi:hypothetical protein
MTAWHRNNSQSHSITSLKTWIFSNTPVRVSNVSLLCPPMQFYESCCLQSTLLITCVVVSETSNTTHPVTQHQTPHTQSRQTPHNVKLHTPGHTTSYTTHPFTQHLNPEDWGDTCTGAHILWRTYTRYIVCESTHGERFGVAIRFKPCGSNNLIHFPVTSHGKGVAEIGLWTGNETWMHHFIAQTKQAGMHFGLLKQCLGGYWLNNDTEVEVAVCEWLQMLEPCLYHDGIFTVIPRLDKFINVFGEYVEK